ncbi:MAG: tail protein X [Clostridiales bacterium]|nr:tail protein X [Clostridiales bacterium]
MEIYRTTSGDTWDKIAYKMRGDGMLMDKLIAENPAYADVFIFPAGVELWIPDKEETTASTLPPWYS